MCAMRNADNKANKNGEKKRLTPSSPSFSTQSDQFSHLWPSSHIVTLASAVLFVRRSVSIVLLRLVIVAVFRKSENEKNELKILMGWFLNRMEGKDGNDRKGR